MKKMSPIVKACIYGMVLMGIVELSSLADEQAANIANNHPIEGQISPNDQSTAKKEIPADFSKKLSLISVQSKQKAFDSSTKEEPKTSLDKDALDKLFVSGAKEGVGANVSPEVVAQTMVELKQYIVRYSLDSLSKSLKLQAVSANAYAVINDKLYQNGQKVDIASFESPLGKEIPVLAIKSKSEIYLNYANGNAIKLVLQ